MSEVIRNRRSVIRLRKQLLQMIKDSRNFLDTLYILVLFYLLKLVKIRLGKNVRHMNLFCFRNGEIFYHSRSRGHFLKGYRTRFLFINCDLMSHCHFFAARTMSIGQNHECRFIFDDGIGRWVSYQSWLLCDSESFVACNPVRRHHIFLNLSGERNPLRSTVSSKGTSDNLPNNSNKPFRRT